MMKANRTEWSLRGKHLWYILSVCILLSLPSFWMLEGDRRSSVDVLEYVQTELQSKQVTVEMAAAFSKRICTQNPYLQSIAKPLDTLSNKMNEMLTHGRVAQGTEASKAIYQQPSTSDSSPSINWPTALTSSVLAHHVTLTTRKWFAASRNLEVMS